MYAFRRAKIEARKRLACALDRAYSLEARLSEAERKLAALTEPNARHLEPCRWESESPAALLLVQGYRVRELNVQCATTYEEDASLPTGYAKDFMTKRITKVLLAEVEKNVVVELQDSPRTRCHVASATLFLAIPPEKAKDA